MALAVFVVSWGYRGSYPKFTDDDFIFVTRGQAILNLGELPCRDFFDEGRPLQYVASALGLWASNGRLAGEVIVDVTLLSVGAAVAGVLAARLAASAWVGLAVGLLVTLLGTRFYNYSKYVVPMVGFWLLARYVSRPARTRLVAAAAFAAIGFHFRHDFGLYLGLAGVVTVTVLHGRGGIQAALRPASAFAATALLCVAPYLMYLQQVEGVVQHVEAGLRFSAREFEAEATRPRFAFGGSVPWVTVLPAPPRPLPMIKVRWAADLGSDARLQRAHRLGLPAGRQDEGQTWEYAVDAPSPEMLRAIVRDDRVEDTHNIDRVTYQLVSVPHEPLWAKSERWFPVLRVRIPALAEHANSVAWFYYVTLSLPVVALLMLLWRRRYFPGDSDIRDAPLLFGIVSAALFANVVLVRDSLESSGRLTEVGPVVGLLGSWLAVAAWRTLASARLWMQWCGRALVLAAVFFTVVSVLVLGRVGDRIESSGILRGRVEAASVTARLWDSLLASPVRDAWTGNDAVRLRAVAAYIEACTEPSDRVLVTWFVPQVYYYSQRGFAGGQPFFLPGYFASAAEQQLTLARLSRQRVPIVVMNVSQYEDRTYADVFGRWYPAIAAHVATRYAVAGDMSFDEPEPTTLRVLVDRAIVPTGTDPLSGLPCFRVPVRR